MRVLQDIVFDQFHGLESITECFQTNFKNQNGPGLLLLINTTKF